MLDYNQPKIRKQIASILINIAKKIEEDEEFAKSIFSQLEENKSGGKNNSKKASKTNQLETKMNIFEIYQNQGSEGLLGLLESLDLQGLKKLVAENGLDPAQKVRRWRKKEKIMNHVIESVGKQMAKGEAFLKWRDFLLQGLEGISSFVPIFTFIIIVALGVDYSIFLMMRFKEYPHLSLKEAIVLATWNIGGVIISAVIILGGTFATLMPSGIILLSELAMAVITGLIALCFLLLPVFVPAMIALPVARVNLFTRKKDDTLNAEKKIV